MKMVTAVSAAVLLAAGSASAQQATIQPMSSRDELKAEKDIQTKLRKAPTLENNRIEVEVHDGVATLKGKVDSEAERMNAEKLAWVKGVVHVDDWLVVRPSASTKRLPDKAVTAEIEAGYRADKTLDHSEVFVDTNDGVVTLSGTISSESARRRAIEVAQTSPGVKRVEDQLRSVGQAEPMLPPAGTPRRH
jgi:hyperosmotically inducible periplasmic protein